MTCQNWWFLKFQIRSFEKKILNLNFGEFKKLGGANSNCPYRGKESLDSLCRASKLKGLPFEFSKYQLERSKHVKCIFICATTTLEWIWLEIWVPFSPTELIFSWQCKLFAGILGNLGCVWRYAIQKCCSNSFQPRIVLKTHHPKKPSCEIIDKLSKNLEF